MWNEASKRRLSCFSRLYEATSIPVRHKTMSLHFFIEGCDWYIAGGEYL